MPAETAATLPKKPRDRVRSCARWLATPETRLLTLTGSPGVGKTWLARELTDSLDTPTDLFEAIYEVSLTDLDNWLLFLPHLAEQLGAKAGQQSLWALKEAALTRLTEHQTVLLVLDAFETVLPAAATLAELLEACPGLTVLVTSRSALKLANEHLLRVSELAPPDPEQPDVQNDSLSLFTTYTKKSKPDLTFSDEDLSNVARLCVHLEGLPLALLTAAQQLKERTLEHLLTDLDDPAYLKVWRLGSLSRHDTLYEALEWRFLQLAPAERTRLACASVLASRFNAVTLDALARTFKDTEVHLEHLRALEDQGFINRIPSQGAAEAQRDAFTLSPLTKDFLRLNLTGTSEHARLMSAYAKVSAQQEAHSRVPESASKGPVGDAPRQPSTSNDVDGYDDPFETDRETLALLTEPLTERELDVIRWVARGLSNREVASRLDISHRTVSTHLSNIYGKLNVRTRTAAALRARQLELVPEF